VYNAITDIDGIRVGHVTNLNGYTGCTVILCDKKTIGGVDIRGAATGTRQLNALNMLHVVEEVNAVLLAGGSAYGLDAAGGVMKYLEEQNRGFNVSFTTVPIVPTAIIFDLGFGDHRIRPDKEMGYQACLEAKTGHIEEGSVGAGTGATVGKLFGVKQATKGGVGTASIESTDGLRVGALVVVNAFGDVLDKDTNRIIAGTRDSEWGTKFINTADQIRKGVVRNMFYPDNTTLAVVATNASLNKNEAHKVAQLASIGLTRCISPVNSTFDGDIVFALSLGDKKADINTLGLLGEKVIMEAINRAVKAADGFGIIPAYKDLYGGKEHE